MDTYLGLLENISGAKTKVFAFVREKLQARINSWSSKLLSKGGKEVLIKSVLTALPTYVMSCYRLPKSLIQRLNSAIANFWWSTSETLKGVHWKKWEQMCRPKLESGLGFRALEKFNSAMLAKQLWRLLEFPNSLYTKVMKGRYFMNQCPLSAKSKGSPSYGWQSISSARSLVAQGSIRRIGDGTTIKVWRDPWIPDIVPRPAHMPSLVPFPDLTLDQFIDQSSGSWKEVLVRQYFNELDVHIILGIPIPKQPRSDYWGWHYTTTGRYSVRSGYQIAEQLFLSDNLVIGPHFQALYQKIWTLNCPGKIKHFLWQTLSGCVAVKHNLLRRGINCDPRCTLCGEKSENINHALFECPPALQTWALSDVPSAPEIFPRSTIWYNMDFLFWRVPRLQENRCFPWIIWNIWKARNDHCFSNVNTDPRNIIAQAEADCTEWYGARNQLVDDRVSPMVHSVVPKSSFAFPSTANPSFTGYRCFVDASWKSSSHRSGLGWFCFPDSVDDKFSGSRGVHRCLSSLHSEVEAVLWALESLLQLHIHEVEVMTDCETVLDVLARPDAWPAFLPYQEEYVRLSSSFSKLSISVIPRLLNHRVDALARATSIHTADVVYFFLD